MNIKRCPLPDGGTCLNEDLIEELYGQLEEADKALKCAVERMQHWHSEYEKMRDERNEQISKSLYSKRKAEGESK